MQNRHFVDQPSNGYFLAAASSVLVLLGIFGMLLVNGVKAFERHQFGGIFSQQQLESIRLWQAELWNCSHAEQHLSGHRLGQ